MGEKSMVSVGTHRGMFFGCFERGKFYLNGEFATNMINYGPDRRKTTTGNDNNG